MTGDGSRLVSDAFEEMQPMYSVAALETVAHAIATGEITVSAERQDELRRMLADVPRFSSSAYELTHLPRAPADGTGHCG